MNVYNVVKYKMYWQFATYMFVHSNWSHLFSNMLGLLIFGISVERSIGSKEFLLFYFLTGILCGIYSFFFHYITGGYFVFLMGASGVIELASIIMAIKNKKYIPMPKLEMPIEKKNISMMPHTDELDMEYALSNSFAFAGNSASILIKRYDGGKSE